MTEIKTERAIVRETATKFAKDGDQFLNVLIRCRLKTELVTHPFVTQTPDREF